MNSHLVTVEVCVVCITNQWVNLDRLAFNQGRAERLNTQAVKGWRTVQQHERVFGDFFQNVPDFCAIGFNKPVGRANVVNEFAFNKFGDNKRLKQLQSHELRQSTLTKLQVWPNNDHRTTGVVDTLSKQVLAEATLFAAQGIGERLQLALFARGSDHRFGAPCTVVDQGVNGFLQHALFVANNNFWRTKFEQTLQTVIAVNHATIQIVQVRSRKTTAVEWNHWTQVWRNNRNRFQNHPLGFHRVQVQTLQQLHAANQTITLGAARFFKFGVDHLHCLDQVDPSEQFAHRFRTNRRVKNVTVF